MDTHAADLRASQALRRARGWWRVRHELHGLQGAVESLQRRVDELGPDDDRTPVYLAGIAGNLECCIRIADEHAVAAGNVAREAVAR